MATVWPEGYQLGRGEMLGAGAILSGEGVHLGWCMQLMERRYGLPTAVGPKLREALRVDMERTWLAQGMRKRGMKVVSTAHANREEADRKGVEQLQRALAKTPVCKT